MMHALKAETLNFSNLHTTLQFKVIVYIEIIGSYIEKGSFCR